jgi:hypothetical protein
MFLYFLLSPTRVLEVSGLYYPSQKIELVFTSSHE